MLITNNKYNFFEIQISFLGLDELHLNEKIEDKLDLVFNTLKTSKIYLFSKKRGKLVYYVQTSERKRRGQLNKLIEIHLAKNSLIENYDTRGLLKKSFREILNKGKNDKIVDVDIKNQPGEVYPDYSAKDISVLDNYSNFYPWQKTVFDMLFIDSNISTNYRIRSPHPRNVIYIYDQSGCTGKSLFFKMLCYKFSSNVAYISTGNSQQLVTSAQNHKNKQIYIVDFPRTLDNLTQRNLPSLVSTLEMLKNGILVSSMYGKGTQVLQDTSHVLVTGNQLLDPSMLSQDRWVVFEIQGKSKKLVDITHKAESIFRSQNKLNKKKLQADY